MRNHRKSCPKTATCRPVKKAVGFLIPKLKGLDSLRLVRSFPAGRSYRGWQELRREDLGALWEHYVLNELHAALQTRDVRYWRDKQGHEVDFVLARRAATPIAIECRWLARDLDPANLKVFRRQYPKGDTYVVAADVERPLVRRARDVTLTVIGLKDLIERLGAR